MFTDLQKRILTLSDSEFETLCESARELNQMLSDTLILEGKPGLAKIKMNRWKSSEKLYRDIRDGLKNRMTHEQVVAKVQNRLILEGRGEVIPMHH